jgi:hypothetical protein
MTLAQPLLGYRPNPLKEQGYTPILTTKLILINSRLQFKPTKSQPPNAAPPTHNIALMIVSA